MPSILMLSILMLSILMHVQEVDIFLMLGETGVAFIPVLGPGLRRRLMTYLDEGLRCVVL
jgi:hypothetical protein